MKLGDRVQLIRDLSVFNIGKFKAGETGTVVYDNRDIRKADDIRWCVKLDTRFSNLDEWDNELQVFLDGEGEVHVSDFVVFSDERVALKQHFDYLREAVNYIETQMLELFNQRRQDAPKRLNKQGEQS